MWVILLADLTQMARVAFEGIECLAFSFLHYVSSIVDQPWINDLFVMWRDNVRKEIVFLWVLKAK